MRDRQACQTCKDKKQNKNQKKNKAARACRLSQRKLKNNLNHSGHTLSSKQKSRIANFKKNDGNKTTSDEVKTDINSFPECLHN